MHVPAPRRRRATPRPSCRRRAPPRPSRHDEHRRPPSPTGRVHFLRFVRHLKWKSIFRKTLRAYVVHELHDSLLCRFVRCFFSPGAPQKAKRTRISARKHPYPRGRFFELLFKIRGRAAPERCCALLRRKRTKARGARMKGAPRRPILTNNPTT